MTDTPETSYARSDGVHIAYQVSGRGPPNIVMVPGFVSNADLMWDLPFSGAALRRIQSFAQVVTFDKRGTGLSDRTVGAPTLEQRMDDVRSVMDAAGVDQATLWGISEGGPMCILFAATYPTRTSSLILQGSFARLSRASDQSFGYPPESTDSIIESFEEVWGTGAVFTRFFPSAADDPSLRDLFARYERNAASPAAMAAICRLIAAIDVRPILPAINVPTLVVHSVGDSIVDVRHGRYLAEHIPGARYLELPSDDHLTIRADEPGPFDDIEEFVTGHRPAPQSDRVLKTVLFTDIVDSTRRAAELGDERWRTLLDHHDSVLSSEIGRFRGVQVKTTGDGFLASFDGPARAIQCALAAIRAVRALDIEVRTGVHTGECLQRGEDLGGIGVHIGARIASLAAPGEVLVSRTVTDLVAGSGIEFENRGEFELRGVPGSWELYRAVS